MGRFSRACIAWKLAVQGFGLLLVIGGTEGLAEPLQKALLLRAKQATVLILTVKPGLRSSYVGSGSGFFVDPKGLIITNAHVVRGASEVLVVTDSGLPTQRVQAARVLKQDPLADLALLKMDTSDAAWLPLTDTAEPGETDSVRALGFPLGVDFLKDQSKFPPISVTTGTVTQLQRGPEGKVATIQTDVTVNPGNSGGPLVDASGHVVGVVRSKIVGAGVSGMAYAIPAGTVKQFLDGIQQHYKGAIAALKDLSFPDIFTNKVTGEVLKGHYIGRISSEGVSCYRVKLDSGKERYLPRSDWSRRKEAKPPEEAAPLPSGPVSGLK